MLCNTKTVQKILNVKKAFYLFVGSDMIGLLANGFLVKLFASRINHITGFMQTNKKISIFKNMWYNLFVS